MFRFIIREHVAKYDKEVKLMKPKKVKKKRQRVAANKTSTKQKTKKAKKREPLDYSNFEVQGCGAGGGVQFTEVQEKDKRDTFLKRCLGHRIKVKVIDMQTQIEAEYEEHDSVYTLVSVKEEETSFIIGGFQQQIKKLRVMHFEVSGPNVETINIQKWLERVADFAILTPRKAVARLELLQSPAHKLSSGEYAIFPLLDPNITGRPVEVTDMIGEIEDEGHTGCGFISEEFLEELFKNKGKTLNTLCGLQIRIYGYGICKGMLQRKRIKSGPPILLPMGSIEKVAASKSGDPMKPLLLVNNAGVDPSKKNSSIMKRMKCIDEHAWAEHKKKAEAAGQKTEKEVPKKLSPMIQYLWRGLSVSSKITEAYIQQSSEYSGVYHAWLRGTADPTGRIPKGYVYITGLKTASTRKLVKEKQLFLTRTPCVKCDHALMVNVMVDKPAEMEDEQYEELESLPFGTLIFSFPSKGYMPMSEVIDGDMDGDRFFSE